LGTSGLSFLGGNPTDCMLSTAKRGNQVSDLRAALDELCALKIRVQRAEDRNRAIEAEIAEYQRQGKYDEARITKLEGVLRRIFIEIAPVTATTEHNIKILIGSVLETKGEQGV
jgi:hypothetical protein